MFGEQPSAAKWNILGTNDAYFDSLIGSGTAYGSWTPTLSGRFDNTKWNKTCSYQQIGKTVFWSIKLVANTTTPMSGGSTDAIFTLPVTADTSFLGADVTSWIGGGGIYDSGTAVYQCDVYMGSSTTARIRVHITTGSYANLDPIVSTVPMNWTTNDEITASGTYEAA